jgi:uncharacterized circularly permuted ATP-grasp superfamily protein
MLREADNSMMAISPKSGLPGNPPPNLRSHVPHFEASAVQGSGIQQTINAADVVQAFCSPVNSVNFSSRVSDQGLQSSTVPGVSLSSSQWSLLEQGLRQRFEAVNACLDEIVRGRRVPAYLRECGFLTSHIRASLGPLSDSLRSEVAWTWFGSTDIHLKANGELTVFDQNFSLPTGLQTLTSNSARCTTADPSSSLLSLPDKSSNRGIAVLLTPGAFCSTGPGNEFIANSLNIVTARNADLCVRGNSVFLRISGKELPVSTIVRRIDDDLLDPNCFRPDSLVGVPGLVKAWKNGGVDVLSPPGVSLASCRTFGKYVPDMILEFLGEAPILDCSSVFECEDSAVLKHVMANVKNFAIRTNDPLHPARPFFGRTGTAVEFADLLVRLRKNPAAYVARPLLEESDAPGHSLRVFATMTNRFRLIPGYISRSCQPDGGAPYYL